MLHSTGEVNRIHRVNTIEIARRIKSGQREGFSFLDPLQQIADRSGIRMFARPKDVRVPLVSRFDDLRTDVSPLLTGLRNADIDRLFAVRAISTCHEYAKVKLGNPLLSDKGGGIQVIEMPVVDGDHSFGDESKALKIKIDETLGQQGSIWYPGEPALQIVELMTSPDHAAAVLEYVAQFAPRQTEVFNAETRFRPPLVVAD